jgi:Spy/CpxP family protein refolding chaperone
MKKTTRLAAFAMMLAIPIVVGVMGCDTSDGSVDPLGEADLTPMGPEAAGAGAGPLTELTVEQIDARVHLSDTQRTQLRDALADLRGAQHERWGHRGRGMRAGAMGDPPIVLFVERASRILTPDQFRELALLARERRDAGIAGVEARRAGRHGSRMGPEAFGPLAFAHLGLSSEQQAQLEPIFRGHADEIRAIRQEGRNGTIAKDEARVRIRAIRLQMREEAKAILTPDQWEKADSFRRERMAERIDERIARLDENLARRADFLARVLGLDPGQAQQTRALILGTVSARTEVLNQLRSGAMEPEDAASRVATIEEALAAQIGALLTPEQRTRWDALRDLLPMHAR